MDIINYTLKCIWQVIDELLPKHPDICQCERCRCDIATFAANRLQPLYVASHHGYVYTKTKLLSQQNLADVYTEVVKAIKVVSRNPHHLA